MSWWLRTRGTTVSGEVVASRKAAEDTLDGYLYTNVIEFDDPLGTHHRFKTRTRLPLKGPVEVVYDDNRPRVAQLKHPDGNIAVHWLLIGSIASLWRIAILAGWWGPS